MRSEDPDDVHELEAAPHGPARADRRLRDLEQSA
jgi:hypothetical protein